MSKLVAIDAVRDDALLIVSELATNAVVHSGSEPDDEFELRADLVPSGLRIAVIDPGRSNQTPARRKGDPGHPGGMGLWVVETLARRWGTERHRRLEVWAELAL
ncbi:MAG: hypothetical protein QOD66_1907 [Solirubrobacteraceae bacterium]|jgi:anti-sigma regulatory factor (Ser/Thr protein kinase)|nr:hypothetical protein [Solirubrobacteraceae bacterium]